MIEDEDLDDVELEEEYHDCTCDICMGYEDDYEDDIYEDDEFYDGCDCDACLGLEDEELEDEDGDF